MGKLAQPHQAELQGCFRQLQDEPVGSLQEAAPSQQPGRSDRCLRGDLRPPEGLLRERKLPLDGPPCPLSHFPAAGTGGALLRLRPQGGERRRLPAAEGLYHLRCLDGGECHGLFAAEG